MLKYLFIIFLSFFLGEFLFAQNVYTINASHLSDEMQLDSLNMGSPGPVGMEIKINNRFMTIGGKPVIPVMGEMHFSRIPRKAWKDVILKMKACGVNIIACYVIWIHHEEIEGKFDWADNKDLRAFIELCKSYDMFVYPRIGPWSHAEVRNGGTPDWVLEKQNIRERSTDTIYLKYADEWYRQIAIQLKGLLYKDGGPVIGVQLENEYSAGKAGEPYILWLKKTAIRYGIDVPMYTVTGWGNASVPPKEVIPLWGAYPDEPWATTLTNATNCENFEFKPFRDDPKIGNGLSKIKSSYLDYSLYPYFTCEMGVGIENTKHRRLQINKIDGPGLVMAKLGSGSNLLGYYMFAGGSNPHGVLTSMEENKETGSYNTNPIISYDFQAAIRETGELNASYYEIKKINYFLNEFGGQLAPMKSIFPVVPGNMQVVARVSKSSAFVFGINYCRHHIGVLQHGIQFSINLPNEKIIFPQKPVDIPDSTMFIWPVNLNLDNVLLKYATLQPLCQINVKDVHQWFFIQNAPIDGEMCFSDQNVASLTTKSGIIKHNNHRYIVTGLKPGADCVVNIETTQNELKQIVVFSKDEANHVWLFKHDDKKQLFISNEGMYATGDSLHLFGPENNFFIKSLKTQGDIDNLKDNATAESLFHTYKTSVPPKTPLISYREVSPLDGAVWLNSSFPHLSDGNKLDHKFFVKDITLDNPSAIQAAELTFYADTKPELLINGLKVNQDYWEHQLTHLDLTGYLKKGNNIILVSFPAEAGEKAFAANINILFENYDNLTFKTDSTWLTHEGYTYPNAVNLNRFKYPQVSAAKVNFTSSNSGPNEYLLSIRNYDRSSYKDAIIGINYAGDKARLYNQGILCADDFYNGTEWRVSLNRINSGFDQNLHIIIYPLQPSFEKSTFFERLPSIDSAKKGLIQSVKIIPEYEKDLRLLPVAVNGAMVNEK